MPDHVIQQNPGGMSDAQLVSDRVPGLSLGINQICFSESNENVMRPSGHATRGTLFWDERGRLIRV
jgi:hypothetical protein